MDAFDPYPGREGTAGDATPVKNGRSISQQGNPVRGDRHVLMAYTLDSERIAGVGLVGLEGLVRSGLRARR